MFLDSNKKLVAVLTTAKTTLNMPVTIDAVDLTTTTTTPLPFQTYTNGVTPVDILSAPAASTIRKVNGLSIYGRDTAAKIIRVYGIDSTPTTGLITAGSFVAGNDYQIVSVGTTDFTLIGASANTVGVIFTATGVGTGTGTAATAYQHVDLQLQIDDTLCYTDAQGWYAVDSQGNLKSVQAASATSIANAITSSTEKVTPVAADKVGLVDSVTGLLNWSSFTDLLNFFAAKLGNVANAFSVANATAQTQAVSGAQLFGYRNKLINANFTAGEVINQRGSASRVTTNAAYNYDRWYYESTGQKLSQGIESLELQDSTVYTVNWSGTATCEYLQSSAAAATVLAAGGWTAIAKGAQLTTSATTVSGGLNLWIRFIGVDATLATLNFPQVEMGVLATPFEFVPQTLELSRCERFYEKSFPYSVAPAQNAGAAGGVNDRARATGASAFALYNSVRFRTIKRVTPVITTYNPAAANAQVRNITSVADCSSTATSEETTQGFTVSATGDAGCVLGSSNLRVNWTASSEI